MINKIRPALTRRAAALFLSLLPLLLFGRGFILSVGGVTHDPLPADTTADTDPTRELLATLSAGLFASAEAIDLSAYQLPASQLSALYSRAVYGEPGLFHVALRVSYRYTEGDAGRLVTVVYPSYTLAGEELAAARALYADTLSAMTVEAKQALGLVENTPLTPAEEASVALYLHDSLAARYDFDTRAEAEVNRDAYRLFRDGVGVCQAYALAYLALCRAMGLDADFVSAEAMDHAWNHVRVGTAWYHVDVTRDDPIGATGATVGVVDHSRFLRSDADMAALGYHGFTCPSDHACDSTAYEKVLDPTVEKTDTGVAWGARHRSPLIALRAGDFLVWVGLCTDDTTLAVYRPGDALTALLPGDLDGDGVVTPGDLLRLAAGYEVSVKDAPPDADIPPNDKTALPDKGRAVLEEARAACLSRLREMLVTGE